MVNDDNQNSAINIMTQLRIIRTQTISNSGSILGFLYSGIYRENCIACQDTSEIILVLN
jgi:hypothetical protein